MTVGEALAAEKKRLRRCRSCIDDAPDCRLQDTKRCPR